MIDAWRLFNANEKELWYSNAGNGFRLDHFLFQNPQRLCD